MRLIDIEDDALLKTVMAGGLSAKALWRRIRNERTVDAVPVVRCKDCRKNETMDCPMRYEYNHNVKVWYNSKADFCSWGERKEND